MSETKDNYSSLKKKHALPDFDELNNDFEISAIESKDFLLREIRRKMDERVEAYLKILNAVLQPEANIADMHECREFHDEEKNDIYKLYKKLMLIHNSAFLAGIRCSEADDAKFILETLKEWDAIKKQMIEIVAKIRDAWRKDLHIKEELGYVG